MRSSRPLFVAPSPIAFLALAGALTAACSSETGGGGGSTTTTSTTATGGTGGTGGTTVSGGTGGTGGTTGGGGTTSSSSSGGTGGAPLPCDPTCQQVQGVPSDCVAITDNAGKTKFGLRMAQLAFNKPDELTAAKNPVVAGVLAKGATINLPDCNLNGGGTFSWLLEIDTVAGTLKTGGAPIQADPTAGYCFVNSQLSGGPPAVSPLTVAAQLDANGNLTVPTGGDVVMPIFLVDLDNYILLPLSHLVLAGTKVSPDHNCIGRYNAEALDPASQCLPVEYTNGGKIEAFMTLEAADAIPVTSLNRSLCSLLTKTDDGGNPKKCPRDANGKITSQGDWCAATNAPATAACFDALEFAGDFAASAVDITGNCP